VHDSILRALPFDKLRELFIAISLSNSLTGYESSNSE
jgi:hypothetical protein